MIAASEVPKLKRVIQSAVLQHEDNPIVFVLFDNLSYMIASVKDGNSEASPYASVAHTSAAFITTTNVAMADASAHSSGAADYKPVVESSFLDSLEISEH